MRTVRRIIQANVCMYFIDAARDSHCFQVSKVTVVDRCTSDTARAKARILEKEGHTHAGAEEKMNSRQEHDENKTTSKDGNRQHFDHAKHEIK